MPTPEAETPARQWAAFLSKYDPKIAALADPARLLKGSGTRVRHIVLDEVAVLDRPPVRALIHQALSHADPPIDAKARRRMAIRSVSAKQRPRRPPAGRSKA